MLLLTEISLPPPANFVNITEGGSFIDFLLPSLTHIKYL